MKENVYFVQVDISSGKDSKVAYLPYTAGVIIANAWEIDEIKENYDFKEFIFLRNDIKSVVENLDSPSVIGFSNYCWNTEYHLALAKEIKKIYPKCKIVFGGHNIPQDASFLQKNAQVDYLCFGEGEITFGKLLCAIKNGNIKETENIAYRENDNFYVNKKSAVHAVDYVSPYLNGWFDSILQNYPQMEFNAIIETSRGCPNNCAYCDWGPLKERTRFFNLEKILEEIEWFGENKIRFVWGADANFGMGKNDLTIADAFVKAKETYGYPERVRINYSKGNSDSVRQIIKSFSQKDLDREGATISLQSLSPVVLENIGRKNMSFENFQKHFSVYREEKLQVYSELILGLPGETYDSFVDGICKLFELGQHFIFEVYNCIVLPNSTLGQKEYINSHEIKTVSTELVRFHCNPEAYYIPEKIDIITGTKTMSREQWKKSALFAAITQLLHACGLTRCFSVYSFYESGISYREFYENLIEFILKSGNGFVFEVFNKVSMAIENLSKGITPKFIVPFVGNLTWDHYEYMFLLFDEKTDKFYDEIMPYLRKMIKDEKLLSDLVSYQKSIIRKPSEEEIEIITDYDFHNYFESIYVNNYSHLEKGKFKIILKDSNPTYNWQDFSKYVVWYGKMGSKSYKDHVETINLQLTPDME